MLALAIKTSSEDVDNCDVDNSDPQQCRIEVESWLVATTIALEGEQNEATRLKAHFEQIIWEKHQIKENSEFKPLYRENDLLPRGILKYNGIRKYTNGVSNVKTDGSDELVAEIEIQMPTFVTGL